MEENKLITNIQFGFRKHRNTEQDVTLLTYHTKFNLDKWKRPVLCCLNHSTRLTTMV